MFGLKGIAIAVAVAGLVGFAGGWKLQSDISAGKIHKLELDYKEAELRAVNQAREDQRRLDEIALDAAKRQAATQAALTVKAKRQLAEVSKHVKNRPNNCVTIGFIRVLDAAVHGAIASSLALPAGVSDDSCAPVDAVTLARSIVDNYNTANANAAQLNALTEVLRQMKTSHDKK